MNNYIQEIVENFNFNSIRNNNDKGCSFASNVLGVIDLDLPSGTLWCKCNLGAENEYDYGDYYAWGELTTKNEYTENNYKYKENHIQLPPEHDVATQTLGEHYSIPTKEQWDELNEFTDDRLVENYKGTGINGILFISKINGNSIFIPAAGSLIGSSLHGDGSFGYVWSSSLKSGRPDSAWYMYLSNNTAETFYSYRFYSLSVRPVFKK